MPHCLALSSGTRTTFLWRPMAPLVLVITGLAVAVLAVTLLVIALIALPIGTAHADPSVRDRAINLVSVPFSSFMAAKSLTRPPFDWSDDACSGPTWDNALPFSSDPCRQHDFGYRNFGRGLTLGSDEAHRRWIDDRLKTELQRSCNERYTGWSGWLGPACRQVANTFHIAVRNWGRTAFYS
jgi:Prokaryotic phospholipase A2